MNQSSIIRIPPDKAAVRPALNFIMNYMKDMPLSEMQRESVKVAYTTVLDVIVETNSKYFFKDSVQIQLDTTAEEFTLEIQNKGTPIFTDVDLATRGRFEEARKNIDSVAYINRGRDGQTLLLKLRLPTEAEVHGGDQIFVNDAPIVEIRDLRLGEEPELSRLFCEVYGYNYVNESVYYPERIREMLESGRLISTVGALPDGRLAGHVGLLRWNDNPVVYEAALGAVSPSVKSKGLFGQLFSKTIDRMNTIPMQYCLYDFVTNHDYSQKLVARYGSNEMALLIGNQVSKTQAKLESIGLGPDPLDMDRYSLLVAINPRVPHPFGKEIILPTNIGEATEFLLKNIGLRWVPAPRFYPLPAEGLLKTQIQKEQLSVHFDLIEPGRQALFKALEEWKMYLQNGFQYASLDIPLNYPGVGQAYDLLAKHGFFMAGYMPYHYSDVLALRFQALAPTKVGFDSIRVSTETGKKLLNMIRADYERNSSL